MAPALSKYNSPPKQKEREGGKEYSPNQERSENLSEKSCFFLLFLGYSVFVSDRFDPFCGPGWCWWSAQREAHCLYANWTAWPLYAFGHIWRHRWLGGYSPSEVPGVESRPRLRCARFSPPTLSPH